MLIESPSLDFFLHSIRYIVHQQRYRGQGVRKVQTGSGR